VANVTKTPAPRGLVGTPEVPARSLAGAGPLADLTRVGAQVSALQKTLGFVAQRDLGTAVAGTMTVSSLGPIKDMLSTTGIVAARDIFSSSALVKAMEATREIVKT
jgi:hypothetical protein